MGKIINMFLLSSIVPFILGFYQLATGTGLVRQGFHRIYGVFLHPNVYAEYLMFLFFISVYILTTYRLKQGQKIALYFYQFIVLASLYFTFTRNVWIALVVSLILYSMFKTSVLKKLAYLFVFIVSGLILSPLLAERFADVLGKGSSQYSSWAWRLQLWEETFAELFKHPYIGHGLGMYEKFADIMAHNDYLRVAFEIGFGGLFLYVVVMSFIGFLSLRNVYAVKSEAGSTMSKILLCLTAALMTISFADNVMRSTVIMLYFFILASIYLTSVSMIKTEELQEANTALEKEDNENTAWK